MEIKDKKIVFVINKEVQTWIGLEKSLKNTYKRAKIIKIIPLKSTK